jgi:hypothetical protein
MAEKYKPRKTKYAEIAFLDTPGLMLDERKDNPRRLGILREADGLVIVLDGFSGVNLAEQLRRFRSELLFADLEIVTNRVSKVETQLKKPRPAKERELDQAELELLRKIVECLEQEKPTSTLGLKAEDEKVVRAFQLFSLKSEFVLVNYGDNQVGQAIPPDLLAMTDKIVAAPVKLELELMALDDESRGVFMEEMGVKELSRVNVIRRIFEAMGRIVFFTVGEDECRSWPIDHGTPAVEAAGVIHTDLSKRFVRAEVIGYDDFLSVGYSEKDAKAKGILRMEGKTYVLKDGDIMHIHASS